MSQPHAFANVKEFATWFLDQGFDQLIPYMSSASINFGPIARAVVFRSGRFQVELWIVWPGITDFPEHEHPDVDTVEVHLVGDLTFTIEGEEVELTTNFKSFFENRKEKSNGLLYLIK